MFYRYSREQLLAVTLVIQFDIFVAVVAHNVLVNVAGQFKSRQLSGDH